MAKKITDKQHADLSFLVVRMALAETVAKQFGESAGIIASVYEFLWLGQSKKLTMQRIIKETNLDAFKVTELMGIAVAMKESIAYVTKNV